MMRIYDGRTEFYQYDTNQKLICDSCKIGEEIHFSNDFYSKAAICKTYELEGSIVVDVPNLYLLTSGELLVYLTRIDNDSRSTLEQYAFVVKERKRPSDYVYTETEVLAYHALEKRIAERDTAIAKLAEKVKAHSDEHEALPGKKLPVNSGEIFNDYENNDSNIPYAHITGRNNKAVLKCFYIKSFTADSITLDSVEGIEVGMHWNIFCSSEEEGYDKHRGTIRSVDSTTNTVTFWENGIPVTYIDQWTGFTPSSEPTFLNTFICHGGTIGTDIINDVDFKYFSTSISGENNIGYINAHVHGTGNKGLGFNAIIEGYKCEAYGERGTAFNYRTKANGDESFAINMNTEANGKASLSQGEKTKANGYASSSFGVGTVASGKASMARGAYNTIDEEGKYLDMVGNGTSDSDRSNAYTLDKEGNVYFAGYVKTKDIYLGDEENPYVGLRFRGETDILPVEEASKGDMFKLTADTSLIIKRYNVPGFDNVVFKPKGEEGVIFSDSYADFWFPNNMVHYEDLIKILDGGYSGFKICNGNATIHPADITFKKARNLVAYVNTTPERILEASITGVKVDTEAKNIKFFGTWIDDRGIEEDYKVTSSDHCYCTDNVYHNVSELYNNKGQNVIGTRCIDTFSKGSSVFRSEEDGWVVLAGGTVSVQSVNGKTGAVSLKAKDVGALPASTVIPKIPTNISAFTNDAGYLTEHQSLDGLATEANVSKQINTHNTDTLSHNDIRLLIDGLTTRLNALADSDDTTLDQISEIVAYIKSNKELIEAVTTSKVNVGDIIDNLTTNVSDKPLSAAQGVVLKALIDAIIVPTKVSELSNDKGYLTGYTETDPTVPAWAKAPEKPTYTASEVGALPNTTAIPTALADLTSDDTHRLVTDTEKSNWDSKVNTSQLNSAVENVLSEAKSIIVNKELKTFIDNTDIDYAFDSATNANYTIIRIYKNKIDGTKQYPFVYAPDGVNACTKTTHDLSNSEGWLLAINSGIFYVNTDGKNGKPNGIVIENGIVIQNEQSGESLECKPLTIDENGNLGYAAYNADASELVNNGIISAVTGFMPIIVDYQPVPSSEWNSVDHYTENAQRQIIGQFGNGDYAIITCEGRNFNNSDGWTIEEAQTVCQRHGLKFAYNLDGGGSTETMLGLKHLNTIYENATGRKVPTFIVFNGSTVFGKPDDLIEPEKPDVSKLPSGYTELPYIVVPNGAYINTGIPASSDYDAEGKQQAGSLHVLSAENYYYPTFMQVSDSRICRYVRYGTEHKIPFEFSYVESYAWSVFGDTVSIDGVDVETAALKGNTTPSGNLYLFCYGGDPTNTKYHFADGKFYYLRLFDKTSGQLLYEYLPCMNPNGVVGLYETVNKKFYGSDTDVAFVQA